MLQWYSPSACGNAVLLNLCEAAQCLLLCATIAPSFRALSCKLPSAGRLHSRQAALFDCCMAAADEDMQLPQALETAVAGTSSIQP